VGVGDVGFLDLSVHGARRQRMAGLQWLLVGWLSTKTPSGSTVICLGSDGSSISTRTVADLASVAAHWMWTWNSSIVNSPASA